VKSVTKLNKLSAAFGIKDYVAVVYFVFFNENWREIMPVLAALKNLTLACERRAA